MLSVSPRFDELTIRAEGAEVRRASEWLVTTCSRRDVPQAPADEHAADNVRPLQRPA